MGLQKDWSRISAKWIDTPWVGSYGKHIMLHIVVNVWNRRLGKYPTRISKINFWISNNPRPSFFKVIILKWKFGSVQILKFRFILIQPPNMKIWFQISYSGQYDQFKPFTAILWVSKNSTTTLKFSETPNIPRGIKFWLVRSFFLKRFSNFEWSSLGRRTAALPGRMSPHALTVVWFLARVCVIAVVLVQCLLSVLIFV